MTRESFEIAVEEQHDERGEPYLFHLSDDPNQELRVYPPTENQLILLMSLAAMDRRDLTGPRAGRAYNLIVSLLDEDTQVYVEGRLQRGTLSLATLFAMYDRLIALESGRPTEQSSDSTPARSTTGKPSAGPARRAASTRSKSPARRSATTSTPGSSTKSASTAKAANG